MAPVCRKVQWGFAHVDDEDIMKRVAELAIREGRSPLDRTLSDESAAGRKARRFLAELRWMREVVRVMHGISDSFLVGSVRLDEHVAAIRAKATA